MEKQTNKFGAASEKQLDFIQSLLEERGFGVVEDLGWDEDMLQDEKFGKARASLVIKELFSIEKNKSSAT